MAQQFNLNLLAQALQPMPYAVIRDQMILLTAIVLADAGEDGSLILSLVGGIEISLAAAEAEELATLLAHGIERAQTAAARQAAQDLGLIQIPGMVN